MASADSGGNSTTVPQATSPRSPRPHWARPRALPSVLICSLVHSIHVPSSLLPALLPRIAGTHTHGSYTRSLMAAPLSCLDCVAHSHYCALQSRPSREAVCSRLPPNIRFRRAENTPFWPCRAWVYGVLRTISIPPETCVCRGARGIRRLVIVAARVVTPCQSRGAASSPASPTGAHLAHQSRISGKS